MADLDNKSRLDNLREKPKDQKTAIASGVAFGVVALLLIGWLVWFLHKIANEGSEVEAGPDFSYLQQQVGQGWWNASKESGSDSSFGSSGDIYKNNNYSDSGGESY